MSPVVILFAKAPVPGNVKTRLGRAFGDFAAARLHNLFVLEMVNRLRPHFRLELHVDQPWGAWESLDVPMKLQAAGDLGLRMRVSLSNALAEGSSRAVIVGSDTPTLPPDLLNDLLIASSDVAFGPTEDGGYYAVAASRTHPAMFHDVIWSSPQALSQTLAACSATGLTTSLGRPWWDVDEPADLSRLGLEPGLADAIRQELARIRKRI